MDKNCVQCGEQFGVTDGDRAFYEKVSPIIAGKVFSIPEPTLCPACRYQRRLAFRNEQKLYHRKCDLSGKQMISMYPANVPFPVYYIQEWQSDNWDPMDYGRDFDFSRPFFEQFQEMCNEVPHFSLFVDPNLDENSEYTNCSSESKNCYLITQAEMNEDCYYDRGINGCKNCVDCLRINDSELCYEGVNVSSCYNCAYIQDCENSSDCYFSTDLQSCKKCFGCHGLVQKEYYIFNEKVAPEEWGEKVEKLVFTPEVVAHMKMKSEETRLMTPQRYSRQTQCENSTGDHLIQCKNAKECFDSRGLEDCKFCNEVSNGSTKDCYDFSMFGLDCELLYEFSGGGYGASRSVFSNHCWQNISELMYCESSFPNVKNCFGSFGLRRAQYCILNKQYTQEEYEELVPKIIEQMRKTSYEGARSTRFVRSGSETSSSQNSEFVSEWGEFFPIKISPYAYNETLAQQYFPLSKEEVIRNGWKWRDEEEVGGHQGPDYEVPAVIGDVDGEIVDKVLHCEVTGKPYRIIKQELDFYRQLGVPVPRKCPDQRYLERFALRNGRKLWDRECAECSLEIQTSYSAEQSEKILCEECYLKAVY
jgi:hypothetical protein